MLLKKVGIRKALSQEQRSWSIEKAMQEDKAAFCFVLQSEQYEFQKFVIVK